MHPDERRIYIALLTAGIIVFGIISFFVITILRYHRKKVSANLLTLQEEMRIQEAERSRIASDLHDDLNSGLSLIKLRLSLIECPDEKQTRLIEETGVFVDRLSDKVRAISNQLLPVVLERYGLQKALEELTQVFLYPDHYRVSCDFEFDSTSLSPQVSVHIYRMFQEIINNILKHSKATILSFRLTERGQSLLMEVSDNGVGFDLLQGLPNQGFGLQNIRMRADLLQAKLFIISARGKGVRYELDIPKTTALDKV